MLRSIIILFIALSINGFGQTNYSKIDLDSEEFGEFAMLDDTLNAYKVYFTGENHMYPTFNTEFQLKFLKYLHQTQNVNHFIFEQSPGLGYIIDEITINGRAAHKLYLKEKFFDPFYYLVKGIEKYNDTLPEEKKIRFHGIDIERFPYFSVYALNDLVERKNVNFEGGEVFEQIVALHSSEYGESSADVLYYDNGDGFPFAFGQINGVETLRSIIETAEENKDSVSYHLGEDSTIFYSIIESMKIGIEWYNAEKEGDVKSPIIRERFMQKEFERIYRASDPDEKYYGQFGRCHTHKDQKARRCYEYQMNSVANRILETDSSLNNQVLVIPIYYTKSKTYDGNIVKDLNLEPKFLEDGTAYIIDLSFLNGNHAITGYDNLLNYAIISNKEKDSFEEYNLKWEDPRTQYHAGFYYGYSIFPKFSGLNFMLANSGSPELDRSITPHYTWSVDQIKVGETGVKAAFTYFLPIDNSDRFVLSGYKGIIGGSFPLGNEYIVGALGLNAGYGMMRLTETTTDSIPNLFQVDGQNKVVYRNDNLILDPNFELRFTFPLISLNVNTGYSFDISGKYWKLDEKLKSGYRKTSFSHFYVQFGASLYLRIRD